MIRVIHLVLILVLIAPHGAWARTEPQDPVESTVTPAPAGPQRATIESGPSLAPLRRAQRSARLGVAMTMPVPGWGQLYADTPFWGVVAFGVQMFYIGSIILEGQRVDRSRATRDGLAPGSPDYELQDDLMTEHRERQRDFAWWAAAGYFVIALDSYVSVSLADFDDPGVPTPDLGRDWTTTRASGAGIALSVDFGF